MEIDPVSEETVLNIRNVFFGTTRVVCENISLVNSGLKFNKVASSLDKSRFNITIPPTDIEQACFCPELVYGDRTLLIKTVPESGSKISAALQLNPNSTESDEYSEEDSIRVTVLFAGDESDSVQEELSQYFSAFTGLDWNLKIIESAIVAEYLDYLYKEPGTAETPPSPTRLSPIPSPTSPVPPSSPLPTQSPQPPSSPVPPSSPADRSLTEDELLVQCASVLNRSTRTYSSILPKMHPNRTSSPKTPSSLRPKLNTHRLRSTDPPSVINIEIDDEDDTENQSNLNASGPSNDDDIILDFPPGESDSITIYKRDLACLEEGEFLTDTILGFYLKHIHRDLIEPVIAERTYIFSTFFYVKLTKSRKEDTQLSTNIADKYYNRVKNWTKNIDIFSKDYLIIPINKAYHWFLAIICYPRKVPDHGEILPIEIEKNPTRPCILFLDSLQGANKRFRLAEPIRHFLTKEWEFKKKTKKNFSCHVIPEYYLKLPKQTNHSDCGLYVLQYVESFLRNPQNLLERVSSNSNLDAWFSLSLVANKRRGIKRLIRQLQQEDEKNKTVKMETDS